MRDLTSSIVLGVLLTAMVAGGCAEKVQPTPENSKARAWVTDLPRPGKLFKWEWIDPELVFEVRAGAADEAIAKLESRSFLELDSNAVGAYVGKVSARKRGKFYLVRCVQSVKWDNAVQGFHKEGRLAILCFVQNSPEPEPLLRRHPVVVLLPRPPSDVLVGTLRIVKAKRPSPWWMP